MDVSMKVYSWQPLRKVWPHKCFQVQKENRLFPVRTFFSLQVKAQGAEGLGGKEDAGGRGTCPRGPHVGGACPGGEMGMGIAENGGVLLGPALARPWVAVDGRKYLEPVSFSEALGGRRRAAFCAGVLDGP